jgi:hypothetical protein
MGFSELWVESYQGEVLGETFFGLLAERETDPVHRHQLEVLTVLEHETKLLAEPVFARNGMDMGDTETSVSVGTQLADGFESLSWEDFVGSIEPITTVFLAKYRELVGLCSDPADRAVAESYVAHEVALEAFARRALGNEPGEPLELILDLAHVKTKVPA